MARYYVDEDRYGGTPTSPLVEAVQSLVVDLVRTRFAASGEEWSAFVFGSSERLITKADLEAVERRILDAGCRFGWSAVISQRERPEAYRPAEGIGSGAADFSFEHPDAVVAAPDATGREQRGVGDNVVQHARNVAGTARYVRSSEQVIELMSAGVAPGTIAIIDDSGGTLTAPVLEEFAAIICAGGTVRSHLGILAREYGIPCLMNAKISGIRDGDTVEIEATAEATTGEAYFGGQSKPARVWRLAPAVPRGRENGDE